MSNTERVHKRFWSAMAERYGRRWTEQYGPESSPAWRELVNRYSPDEVKLALAELPKAAPEFPPTMPQFEAILAKVAQRRRADTTDYIRGFWRSMVVLGVSTELGHSAESLEPYVVAHRHTLGEAMRNLLDDLDSSERRIGQRTEGLLDTCARRCREIAVSFPQLRRVA